MAREEFERSEEMAPAYEPQKTEEAVYARWEASGFFNPDKLAASKVKSQKLKVKSFSIIMPPPNANGALHIGHALFVTLQDIMTRFHRMKGEKTLWLPGADHAGIETEFVYRKKLDKEGKRWHEIPRDELYREIFDFTQKNKSVMENQLKKLGASCDWSREKFTLDPEIVEKVQDSFIQMYKDGLIYRGSRIINWSVRDQTSLSDLEVKYEERNDPLYYIKYGPLELATVRPETKFGDTAVAVNPKDKRHRQYIGKEIEIETVLGKAKIKVIADDAVDQNFGTGAVKVTPAHDPADFEIAMRHNLEIKQVIDKFGRMNEKAGPYKGLKVEEARKRVVEDMQKKELITKIDESYRHSVAVSMRSGGIIEPMVIPQWFVAMPSLRDAAVKTVKSGKITFIPKRFEKIFFNWMKNLRDWNISRQIIWGIRIPAWFKGDEIYVGKTPPAEEGWTEDPDVLDTWFSSGQWPFVTLLSSGASKSKIKNQKSKILYTTDDFETFYPTSVMETGWDIFFFWVARMIMLGIYRTGDIPFKTVYLHGLVRDKDRQKMSKSKGNAIDPLGVAETYGTDAVRMALVIGNTAGNDPIISEEKIRGYRNFANKIWNASRFVLLSQNKTKITNPTSAKALASEQELKIKLTKEDKKNLKELQLLVKTVTKDLDEFKFHHAAEKLYRYFWHTFADNIIERAKSRLTSRDKQDSEAALAVLLEILETNLKLLHPFMPFVTETIWEKLPGQRDLLMIESWPK